MRPCLKYRRVVEVKGGRAWEATLRHRVYSCPDVPQFDFVLNATALLLNNATIGARVPLEVVAVEKFTPGAQPDALPVRFRARVTNYLADALAIPGIITLGHAHRFYLLSDEPWPNWLQQLTSSASMSLTEWTAILSICTEQERFFEWPQVGELLWSGFTRGDENQVHHYPVDVAARLLKLGIHQPDTRNNGPTIMAFLAAGGLRPTWENEGWPVHQVYDGTAPILGDPPVVVPRANGGLCAVQDGCHFTHSAGLVATHPIAHHLAHQSPLLKWFLRREAYIRFGYDPEGAFSR